MRNSKVLFLFTSFILISFPDIVPNKFYQIDTNKPIKKIEVKVSTNIPGIEYTLRKIAFGTAVFTRLKHCFLTNSFQYIAFENLN